MNFITRGIRHDTFDLFTKSDLLTASNLNHTPFLVIESEPVDDAVYIAVVGNKEALLTYPDSASVLAQWKGQFRSDWLQFTVGDVRRFLETGEAKK